MSDARRGTLWIVVVTAICALAIAMVGSRDAARETAHVGAKPGARERHRRVEVAISGCAAMRADACELGSPRELRVFASGAVTIEGARIASSEALEHGGTLHRVVAEGQTLRVRDASGDVVTMTLALKSAPAWLDDAKAKRQSGDVAGARAIAEAHASGDDRAFALDLLARLALAAGRQDESFAQLREAIALHRKAGRISDAADDVFALVFALNQRSRRYAEARAQLDDVRSWLGPYADGRAREAYYRGTLATETGDARTALHLLDEADLRATRLGLDLLARNARNARAMQLALVGRTGDALDALDALDRVVRAKGSACEAAEVAINLGFARLRSKHAQDAREPLERALRLVDGEASCDRYLRTAALGNLALADLHAKDPNAAAEHLRAARIAKDVRGAERLFWGELEGDIALARGDANAALAAFDDAASFARSLGSLEGEWRASTSRGAALEALGKPDEALAAYRTAEARLDEASLLVPLGEGRGTFVGDHEESARAAIAVAIDRGRVDEALAIARASRARVVAQLTSQARVESFDAPARARWDAALEAWQHGRAALDAEARDDWKLDRAALAKARAERTERDAKQRASLEAVIAEGRAGHAALAPLPDDVVSVLVHPSRQGWVGFVTGAGPTTSFALASLPPNEALADALLGPAKQRLARVPRLAFLGHGPLRSVDVHALSWNGAPVAAAVTVTYPLDIGARAGAARAPRVVVVSDPTLDLGHAHDELGDIERLLRRRSIPVDVLDGKRATRGAVLPLLGVATHLHFAGHGVYGGREGWSSALPLAEGSSLGIGDVLAAPGVPPRVVLSGCEAARADDSLGLAQAFMVAGADVVIAPARPIRDDFASAMTRALYADGAIVDASPRAIAEALRRAQNELRAADASTDWAAFRAVTR